MFPASIYPEDPLSVSTWAFKLEFCNQTDLINHGEKWLSIKRQPLLGLRVTLLKPVSLCYVAGQSLRWSTTCWRHWWRWTARCLMSWHPPIKQTGSGEWWCLSCAGPVWVSGPLLETNKSHRRSLMMTKVNHCSVSWVLYTAGLSHLTLVWRNQ